MNCERKKHVYICDTFNKWTSSVLLLGLAVNVTLAVVFATVNVHQNLKSANVVNQ